MRLSPIKILPAATVLSLSFILLRTSGRAADDFQGADAILKQVDAQTTVIDGSSSKADLKSYRGRVARNAPRRECAPNRTGTT